MMHYDWLPDETKTGPVIPGETYTRSWEDRVTSGLIQEPGLRLLHQSVSYPLILTCPQLACELLLQSVSRSWQLRHYCVTSKCSLRLRSLGPEGRKSLVGNAVGRQAAGSIPQPLTHISCED